MEYIKINDKPIAFQQIAGGLWTEKTCYICRKHFQDGEKIAVIVCPSELRKQFPAFKKNQVVHLAELRDYIESVKTVEELFIVLSNAKRPKKEVLTKEQDKILDTFINAAYNIGYKDASKKKDGSVSCKKYGSSDTLIYNVYSDRIEFRNRRRRQFGDGFTERSILAKAFNEFHKLLGDGKHDDYDPLKAFSECLSGAIETTNRIMGGK